MCIRDSFLTAYIILEAVRSQNSRAKRLMVPVFILALASCAEIINYHLKFVASLSLLYQIGTLLFIIIMGIIMGLNISDMLMIKRENERLIFDMNLLEHSRAKRLLFPAHQSLSTHYFTIASLYNGLKLYKKAITAIDNRLMNDFHDIYMRAAIEPDHIIEK